MNIYVDSDWAGEGSTRKSASGGAACLGGHPVKTWASTQNVVALSTGEAECYAIVNGSSSALGVNSLLEDLRHRARVNMLPDATTGKTLASRRRLGKVRHIEVSELWVQEAVKKERVELVKIKGTFNSADLFTKHVDRSTLDRMVEGLRGMHEDGRYELAPQLSTIHEEAARTGRLRMQQKTKRNIWDKSKEQRPELAACVYIACTISLDQIYGRP